jgi:CRP-like cAMP-binding protein
VRHLTLHNILRDHAFTSGLADCHVATLASLATLVTFASDELILTDHEHSRYLYLITAGSVSIELRTPIFNVSVQAVGPGEAFGWSALLRHQDTLFQARARERTAALRFAGEDLLEAGRLESDLGVEILLRMLQVAAGRIRATEVRFAEMCGVRTPQRFITTSVAQR